MGTIQHRIIVVVGFSEKDVKEVHKIADRLFERTISEVLVSPVNNYFSFYIPPDGSKEGWTDSGDDDEKRKLFLREIDKRRYEDGSNGLKAVEVAFGDFLAAVEWSNCGE